MESAKPDEALARFVTEVSGGGHAAKDTTLSELIRRWLNLVREDLSPSTVRGYERIIRCYIEPDIGRVSLVKLRTDLSSTGSIQSYATKAARMAGHSRRQQSDRRMLSFEEHSIRRCVGAGLQPTRRHWHAPFAYARVPCIHPNLMEFSVSLPRLS